MGQHSVMAEANHDESSREDFIASMYFHVQSTVFPGNQLAYDGHALPSFKRDHNRAPRTRHEVRGVMEKEPFYQWWSSLRRTTQEMKQATGEEMVHRQIGSLIEKTAPPMYAKGSLTLDPSFKIPRYLSEIDFHAQPGGYFGERVAKDDVTVGAIYDPGVYVLTQGFMGRYCEGAGASVINFLKRSRPGFAPMRILDIGCSVGHSTVPYADAYPGAEIQAIDASAQMLRYGHARTEAMGYAIHYSQQNAERTDFESGSFDLVMSHIVLHETSRQALNNIIAECKRLLRPGGVMIHIEQRQHGDMEPFEQFTYDWDTLNNNEPFWGTLHDMDLVELAAAQGFDADKAFVSLQPNVLADDMFDTRIGDGQDFKRQSVWSLFGAEA